MEIQLQPCNLQIGNTDICMCCNSATIKEIRKGSYLIHECGYCRYGSRPFAQCNDSWHQHFPDGCACEYGEKDYLYIICKTCQSPKCKKCNKNIICWQKNCNSHLCNDCEKKIKFNEIWKTTTPQEKLHLYGTIKLKILAKNKQIKNYSKLKKGELIAILSPIINANDFPIKSIQ